MTELFGYGQRSPEDFGSEYAVWSFIVQQALGKMRIAMPVQVINCTNSGGVSPFGYVTVQPLVNQVDGLGNALPHARIFQVPYFRIQGGTNAIIIDPEPNDIGVAVFADRDISHVKDTQQQSTPGSRRQYDLSDAMYFGGILNKVPKQYVEFVTGSGVKIVDINGNVVNMNASGIDITAARLTCTGSIIAGFGGGDQVGLQTHTHTQGVDSHGDTEVPVNPPTPGT